MATTSGDDNTPSGSSGKTGGPAKERDDGTDILYVSYNRPDNTEVSLPHLLETCTETDRVWVWQNGSDPETLKVVQPFADHPRVYRFHHSEENQMLRGPTNWVWENSHGKYLSKVDDDAILPSNWLTGLREALEASDRFGIVGCWRFREEDFIPKLAEKKIATFDGQQILQNLWVEGSGYLMRRECVEQLGPLQEGQTFTRYCIELGRRGWINGWVYPFIYQEDMEDPRSPHTVLHTDEDLMRHLPLGARKEGITTIQGWIDRRRVVARLVQEASIDPRAYFGWRRRLRNVTRRLVRILKGRRGVAWDSRW